MLSRTDKTAAHVGPFLAFMLLMPVAGWFRHDVPQNPWWRQAPEHWVYPLQVAVSLGLIAWWWRNYQFRPAPFRALLFGAAIGLLGITLWILPSVLHDRWHVEQWGWPKWLTDSLGLASRGNDGFNPELFHDRPAAWATTVFLRLVRMTIAVPLLEEVFWRGFLWRYFAAEDRPVWKLPFATWHPRAIAITILLFAAAHHQVDWLGAIIYGALISWVALRTKSLAACVVCHATSNFVLGVYVMTTRQWGFW